MPKDGTSDKGTVSYFKIATVSVEDKETGRRYIIYFYVWEWKSTEDDDEGFLLMNTNNHDDDIAVAGSSTGGLTRN